MRAPGLFLFSLLIVTLSCSLVSVSAQDSFCVKYSKALFGGSSRLTNYQLLNAVVARVTVGCNNNAAAAFGVANVAGGPYDAYKPSPCGNNPYGITSVPGLVSDTLNAPFFAGKAPAFISFTNATKLNTFGKVNTVGLTSIPFVNVNKQVVTPLPATLGGNISATVVSEGLITHLISFFGIALGCDVDFATNTNIQPTTAFIGKYNGVVNMTAVHVGMAINLAVWNEFANTFILTLKSFGVQQADIDGTITPYLSQFLRGPQGTNNVICNQANCPCAPQFSTVGTQCVAPPPTFCQKYSKALFGVSSPATNYKLLNAVVARVTVGCNNIVAQAFGVSNVNGTIFGAYSPQACGANPYGITMVPGLVADQLNAPFFAGTAPAFQSFTNAAALNAFSGTAPTPGVTAGITSIPFVGVNGKVVNPFAATTGGNIAANTYSEGLIQHLISFFGIALGCEVDMMQNTNQALASPFIGRYNGVVNMTAVHVGMAINWAVWQEFANTFIMSLKSFGVAQADIDGTITPYLQTFLRGPLGTNNVICNQADCPCAPQFNTVNGQCVVPPPPTFCQKYSKALFGSSTRATNYALLNAVVARVTVGCNNNVAQAFGVPGQNGTVFQAYSPQACGANQYGITMVPGLVSDTLNGPFFAGTAPAFQSVTTAVPLNTFSPPAAIAGATFTSIRFLFVKGQTVAPYAATTGGNIAPNTYSEGLIQHLISFFGIALGCDVDLTQNTNQAVTSPFIGKYNGVINMTAVHAGMAINQFVWDEFSNTFIMTLKSFGVAQTDIDGTIRPYLATFLRGPQGTDNVICNQPDCMCAPQFNTVGTQCVVPATAPPTLPPPTQPAKISFCSKYAAALFGVANANTEYRLLQAVIARVILGCNNNVAAAFGIPELAAFAASACGNVQGFSQVAGLVSDPFNAPFFNGVAPNYGSVTKGFDLNKANNVSQILFPSIRFVSVNGQAVTAHAAALGGNIPFAPELGVPAGMTMFQEGLITHLIAFFGRDLGCASIDFLHDTITSPIGNARIGKYNGAPSMFQVHQNMKITKAVWDEFANTFVSALMSFGVTQADIDGTIVPYVSQFLRGPQDTADMMICNQPDCACAPQFQLVNGQCVDPANPGTNTQTQGGKKIGQASGLLMSPIVVAVVTVMAYLFA